MGERDHIKSKPKVGGSDWFGPLSLIYNMFYSNKKIGKRKCKKS